MSKFGRGVEGVDYLEFVEVGKEITLIHSFSGEKKQVKLYSVSDKDAFVEWPMCGVYEIDLKKGALKQKKASLWKIDPDDLRRVRNSVHIAERHLHERFKKNKG